MKWLSSVGRKLHHIELPLSVIDSDLTDIYSHGDLRDRHFKVDPPKAIDTVSDIKLTSDRAHSKAYQKKRVFKMETSNL